MNRLTKIILFCIVGVILTVAVMVPITSDMTEKVVTSHNQANTKYKYASFFQEEELENRNGIPYVSGTPLREISEGATARVLTDDFAMQSVYNSETDTYGPWYVTDTGGDIVSTGMIKAVFEKGKYTIYNGSNEVTSEGTYTFVLLPAKNGDYVASSMPVYANGDSTIYVFGTSTSGNTIYSGSVNDGLTVVSTSSETTPTATLTTTLIQESSQLYEITSYSITEQYRGIYVPLKYYEITPQDETIRTIIGLYPLFVTLILIVGAGGGLMSYIQNNRGGDI